MHTGTLPALPETFVPELALKGFNIHKVTNPANRPFAIGRRNYYKIVLTTGHITIGAGDNTIETAGSCLFFANPQLPHSVTHHSAKNTAYACVFTAAFFSGRAYTGLLRNSPLFRTDIMPLVPLNEEQTAFMTGLYRKMQSVRGDDHEFRKELIKSCIALIIHEAASLRPPPSEASQKNAATRITHLFLELMERQFPIESTTNPLQLRTASDFAGSLSVHVNYLNRAVKKVTGKPTTAHIAERIAAEAIDLLQYTDWSVSDIAYSLGFEYPTYFNNYFKRITGFAPKHFRQASV